MPDGPELSALAGALGPAVLDLVDHLPGTMFCVKGADGRYIAVNPTFVERTNKRSRAEVLGRRAGELFVAELADRYEEQDARVHSSGRPLFNELELIRAPGGPFRWHVTAKVPLRDEDGRVTGVVSMSQDVGEGAADDRTMTSLGAVVAHIRVHLGENVTSQDLARVAGCSVDTLERRCRRVFGRSPGQLILSTRIDVARGLLTGSDMPLAQIADLCGYADQAGFSRTFTRLVGIPPGRYRKSM
ncbi:AraC family transcriptional regulator [Dermacoccus barathri]|uniref:AraC family transcriptional regulator n=1 Tax=Dermacoccus abyssi TaxID=322596 RepID=A0ABX5ZC07_9MICO|nr:AraC family transcriptional regulator [Dermacoccus barathri]MBE7371685.1 AraC family transcriptional regulator [Dermacoccus barathri]QEH94281.1 AraC family transcriptional regulator [Dermacoccus abyssi]